VQAERVSRQAKVPHWIIVRSATGHRREPGRVRRGPLFADLHFHGLRKTTSKALAEADATPREIQAVTGHATQQMVEH
jgi:integrase